MELYKQILKCPWKNEEPGKLNISALPDVKTYEFILIKALYFYARINTLARRVKQRPQNQTCTYMGNCSPV